MATHLTWEIELRGTCDVCDEEHNAVIVLVMSNDWENVTFEYRMCLEHFIEMMRKGEKTLYNRLNEIGWNS